uniref:Uncharacterized protein n=1 Tax=Anguilla anguilla TaxID=7936 RepID=A0A0E9WFK1_ANGAN
MISHFTLIFHPLSTFSINVGVQGNAKYPKQLWRSMTTQLKLLTSPALDPLNKRQRINNI